MRPKAQAQLLLALLAATFVIRPLAHGVTLASVLVFWATALGQVIVPGVLLVRGSRLPSSRDNGLLLGQGASVGLALQGLSLLAGRALSAAWLPTASALVAAALGLWLARRAPKPPVDDAPETSPLTIGIVLLAAVLQPLASARDPGEVPLDLLFHAGNAAELRHRWPLEDPRAAGIPLAYHLLAYCLPVEAADRAAAPVADPLLALAPLLWVTLLALQTANAGRLLFGNATAGAIGAALVVLHTDPGRFLGLPPGAFNSHLATGVYGSPTTVVGLALLAALLIAIDDWLVEGRKLALGSVALLALAASAAKTTVLPAVWAGLGVLVLHALLRRRPVVELRRAFLALVAAGAVGAPLTLWQTGGQEGYTGIVRLAPASVFTASAFAASLARWVGAVGLPPWLAAPGFVLWLVGYLGLAGVAAALWLVRRREPLGALQVFSLGAIAAALALGLALDVPGLSQLFLIYDAQLLLALFGGAGLVLWRPQRPLQASAVAALSLVALLAVPYAGQLARGVPGALSEDWSAASRTPSPVERDYTAGLDWLRAHASRGAVVFADNPSLLLSALGEVRLFYENGVYTARAWHVAPGAEPWPERVALQQQLLRRPDAATLDAARRTIGPGPRLLVVADSVQSRIEAGIVHAAPGPVPPLRFFPEPLFARTYVSGTLQVYEAREGSGVSPR